MRAVSADFTITMQRRLSKRSGGKVPARPRGLCEHPIAAVECPDLTLSEFGLTYSALILAARITFALSSIRLDDYSEFLRRINGRLKAELCDPLSRIGIRDDPLEFGMHLIDDDDRRSGGRQQPEPGNDLKAWKARLRKRWQFGNNRRAPERGDRKCAQLAIANDRQDHTHVLQSHSHPSADHVGKDRATIGNMDHVHASE